MTVVALAGGKGSPGATTLAVALAAIASTDIGPLIVEADPAGGDIAVRCGLALDPGLLSLAAAGRRGTTATHVESHSQTLPSGARVLLGPTSPEQATSAITGIAPVLARTLAARAEPVIIDIGRWDARSAAAEFVGSASRTLLVVRPTVEGVEHARWQIASLSGSASRVAVVSIGERPYPPDEVRAALEVDEFYVIEDDVRAARSLGAGAPPDRWLRRSPLLRSAAALAERLFTEVDNRAVVR